MDNDPKTRARWPASTPSAPSLPAPAPSATASTPPSSRRARLRGRRRPGGGAHVPDQSVEERATTLHAKRVAIESQERAIRDRAWRFWVGTQRPWPPGREALENAKRVSWLRRPLLFLSLRGRERETALLGEHGGVGTGDPVPGAGEDVGTALARATASTGTDASMYPEAARRRRSAAAPREPSELAGITGSLRQHGLAPPRQPPASRPSPGTRPPPPSPKGAASARAAAAPSSTTTPAAATATGATSARTIYASSGKANGPGAPSRAGCRRRRTTTTRRTVARASAPLHAGRPGRRRRASAAPS